MSHQSSWLSTRKRSLGAALFRLSSVRRIHIIGCARSGTTFLQYCMISFQNTVIANAETSPHYPDLIGKVRLAAQSWKKRGLNFITKRNYGWFEEKQIEELLQAVDLYQIGIILVVRDPRAVMASRHRRADDPTTPYVDEDRWYRSMLAGEAIWRELKNYPSKCVVRYEDLIRHPVRTEKQIAETFELRRHPDLADFNQVKTNVERLGFQISASQQLAMHNVRDASKESLRRNLPDVDIQSAAIRQKYTEIMDSYATPRETPGT